MIQQTTQSAPANAAEITEATPRAAAQHELSEYYEALLRRLRNMGVNNATGSYALGITSCAAGEGVTTIAANLAISAARASERPVLLIDADMSNRAVATLMNVDQSPGLANVLAGELCSFDCVQPTSVLNLSVLAAGPAAYARRVTCDYDRLAETIADLKRDFGLIVCDLPNADELSECFTMAGLLDGVLMVVEADRVRRDLATRAKQQLEQAGGNVLGVIFNKGE